MLYAIVKILANIIIIDRTTIVTESEKRFGSFAYEHLFSCRRTVTNNFLFIGGLLKSIASMEKARTEKVLST